MSVEQVRAQVHNPASIARVVLWPLAIATAAHRLIILAPQGNKTDDFTPVYAAALKFLRRQPVYTENYNTVDPHYLYPPSGTLLMSPLGHFDPDRARNIFIAGSVIALLLAIYLLVRLFGFGITSPVLPAALFFAFCTETVTNTLVFTNFNSFVLLGEVIFLMLLMNKRAWWAGVPLGITLAVKPLLAPLLLIPLLNRQWQAIVTAVGVPAVLTAVAWPMSKDPASFVHRTAKYLNESRDYFNSSLSGNGTYFGIPHWLIIVLRIAFVAIAVATLVLLYRFYRTSDELLWMTTSSGVLLSTLFLCGALGQAYYSMLLFPMLMTVVLRNSAIRVWPFWLGVYGAMSYDSWLSRKWTAFGRAADYSRPTLGWMLMIIVPFIVLLYRYLDSRADPDEVDEPTGDPARGAEASNSLA